MHKKYFLIALTALLSPIAALAQTESKATNYHDCILEATREGYVRDRSDIGRIKLDCIERFPDTAPQVLGQKLKGGTVEQLEIYTHAENDGSINGTVYNGNSHIILTRLHLLLTPKRGDSVQDFFDSEEFEINVNVLPNKTGNFKIDADKIKLRGNFRWKLINAWGY